MSTQIRAANLSKVIAAVIAVHPDVYLHPNKSYALIIPTDAAVKVIMEEQNEPIIDGNNVYCLTRCSTNDRTNVLIAVHFEVDNIMGNFNADTINADAMPEVINVLANNTDLVVGHAGDTIPTERQFFNDSFVDMMEDLAKRLGGSYANRHQQCCGGW